MAVPLRFNFKDLADLNTDLSQSKRALPVIVQRVLGVGLRSLAREMRPGVARGQSGQLQRSFGASVRRVRGNVLATFGFLTNRRMKAGTVVAGNVQQKGQATPRRGAYLWIPTRANTNITPRDFFSAENTFVRDVGGKKIAFVRNGEQVLPLFVLQRMVRLGRPPLPIEQRVEQRVPEINQEIVETIAQVIEARKAAIGSVLNG